MAEAVVMQVGGWTDVIGRLAAFLDEDIQAGREASRFTQPDR